VRLTHSARTTAGPARVWELLGDPRRWPEFEAWLHKVVGAPGRLVAGQRLMGRVRFSVVRIPMDVVEVVPGRRVVLLVHVAPGVRHQVTTELTPTVDGGCDLRVSVVVDGPFAPPAALPLWLASGLSVRLLAARADAEDRRARRAEPDRSRA
jgi:uncharacterized protein YndB with AHSA1/START domain